MSKKNNKDPKEVRVRQLMCWLVELGNVCKYLKIYNYIFLSFTNTINSWK